MAYAVLPILHLGEGMESRHSHLGQRFWVRTLRGEIQVLGFA